jgi:hypothetical protein
MTVGRRGLVTTKLVNQVLDAERLDGVAERGSAEVRFDHHLVKLVEPNTLERLPADLRRGGA